MVATTGLVGFRPHPDAVDTITAPPYDVIKPGTPLEKLLFAKQSSVAHISLGEAPKQAFDRLVSNGELVLDDEPAYYVYEQNFDGQQRTGVFAATAVTPYAEHQIIRHEKTFDHKVKGRIALAKAIDHTIGPVFLLTRAPISKTLDAVKNDSAPTYDFSSDFGGYNDLHGIHSRVWRVPLASEHGKALQSALAQQPLYIADGHHRYHASLLYNQTHFLSYITEEAKIQAYNRVINGTKPFAEIKDKLNLEPTSAFATPNKHEFCIYTKDGSYTLKAKNVPNDVVGRLDCSILERELYPLLGLEHSMIADLNHFDYYPESALADMQAVVDNGTYDIAVALHPVAINELMAVADAGLQNPDIVMPEKSTFFAPKVLTGLFFYRHTLKG